MLCGPQAFVGVKTFCKADARSLCIGLAEDDRTTAAVYDAHLLAKRDDRLPAGLFGVPRGGTPFLFPPEWKRPLPLIHLIYIIGRKLL